MSLVHICKSCFEPYRGTGRADDIYCDICSNHIPDDEQEYNSDDTLCDVYYSDCEFYYEE